MTAQTLPAYVTDQHTDNGHGFCTCCGGVCPCPHVRRECCDQRQREVGAMADDGCDAGCYSDCIKCHGKYRPLGDFRWARGCEVSS